MHLIRGKLNEEILEMERPGEMALSSHKGTC
jgi:hypothetical protein